MRVRKSFFRVSHLFCSLKSRKKASDIHLDLDKGRFIVSVLNTNKGSFFLSAVTTCSSASLKAVDPLLFF